VGLEAGVVRFLAAAQGGDVGAVGGEADRGVADRFPRRALLGSFSILFPPFVRLRR
jgi:hypothetical protein